MIHNLLRIAFRNISKNKGFTLINVSGLAIGLAAALLILLWVQEEYSYEKFNLNAEHIYRVEEDQYYSGERYHVTVTPHPSGPVWKEKIPEIVDQTRINRFPRLLFRLEDKVFFESNVITADSGLFRIFTLPLLLGDPSGVLESPHSIVLSEKLAKKYFGDRNPLGQSLTIENKYNFMVSGVMKDLPRNSMFSFEAVLPYSFLEENGMMNNSWGSNSILTFVQIEEGSDISAVNTKLTDVVLEYLPQTTTKYLLFPLLDIHLHAQFGFEQNNGPVTAIIIFTTIAFFLLLIASINFINLSTAKASTRAKEIGIRKVAGADRRSIVIRFMSESLLLVLFASILALVLVGLSLDLFNSISGRSFVFSDLFQPKFILSFVSAVILTGIFAGIYPALYLSSFRPVAVLKGEGVQGSGSGRLRKILVVLQFTLSILITVTAVFLYIQLKYLQSKDLGFDKENLVCIQMAENMKERYYLLKDELLQHALIEGVTASTRNPVMIGSNSGGASWDGKDPEKRVLIGTNGIDYDYLETMKMDLVSGRSFSRDFQGDLARDTTGNFLINEEVARIMDVGDPVGKNFRFMGISGTIIGVLKNFHFKGADEPIEPIAFALTGTNFLNAILIRLTPGKTDESLKVIGDVWSKLIPEYPLDYSFVDQDYENLFRPEIRLTKLLGSFTVLTLIIACLGLYGLSSYSTERRTNEIGIRKVMGAETGSVVITMAGEFLSLVAIAIILSFPVGYFLVKKLLSQFAFRIDLSPAVFILIAFGALAVAMFTVSFQAYRASCINPAEALKVE